MSVLPYTVNRVEPGYQEWRGALFLQYEINLLNLPPNCYRWGTAFSNSHALDFQNGVVATTRHNELHYRVANLFRKARDEPLIYPCHTVQDGKAQGPRSMGAKNPRALKYNTEQKGGLLIHDLCQQGVDSIRDMRVVNTGDLSYQNKFLENVSSLWKRG